MEKKINEIKSINEYRFSHFDTEQVRAIIRNRMMYVTLDDSSLRIQLDKVAGLVNKFIEEDGKILCEWKPFETNNGKIANKIAKNGIILPIGVGTIKNKVVQDDYILLHLVIIDRVISEEVK